MATPPVTVNPAAPAAEAQPVIGNPPASNPPAAQPPAIPPAAVQSDPAQAAGDFSDVLKDDLAPVVEASAADPLLKYKDDPLVQGLIQEKQQFGPLSEVIKGNRYTIQNQQELKLHLDDANVLYDVVSGRAPASKLLDTMLANPEWPQANKDGVLADLRSWLEKKTGQPIAAAAAGQLGPDGKPIQQINDPAMAEIEKLKAGLKAREDAEAKATFTKRVESARTAMSSKVNSLLENTWMAGEGDYVLTMLGSKFPGEKVMQVIEQVERGDFTQVEKALREIKNDEAKRHVERNKRLLALQQKKTATIPSQPSSGSPAAAEQPGNIVELDADKRRQRMLAEYRSGQ